MINVIDTLTQTKGIHLGIDGNEANVEKRSGISSYAYSQLHAFYQLNSPDTFTIYLKEEPLANLPPERDDWQYRVLKPASLWYRWRLPLDLSLSFHRPEVFYSPGHYIPQFSPVPIVITVHDLTYLKFPNLYPGGSSELRHHAKRTNDAVKKATSIIIVSKNTRRDVTENFGIAKDRVNVVYPGLDEEEFLPIKNKEVDRVRQKFQLNDRYYLFVGNINPQKNLTRTLQAFERLPEKLKEMELVLAGNNDGFYQDFLAALKQSPKKGQVKLLGYVPEEDLPALYSGATALLQPGIYEGFGPTVLEALASGTPVVAAKTAALPEVVGDAGIFVDPYSISSITHGMELSASLSQAKLRQLKKRAKIQVGQFDWEITARQIRKILHHAAGLKVNPV